MSGRAEPVRHRMRHVKRGLARFVSHIDLIHYFSRLAARARVPVAFTEGFNPKPKFEFGPALSTGIESDCEWLDLFLPAPADPAALVAALARCGVPDLAIVECVVAPPAKLSRSLVELEYRTEIAPDGEEACDLPAFLAGATVAALEGAGIAAPGFVTAVEPLPAEGAAAALRFVTAHRDGRALSPRLLEKLPAAAGLRFHHRKILARFAP